MTDQRSAKEHFNEIVDAPAEARSAYLGAHCNDPALRSEVQGLLEAYDRSQSFMSRPAAELLEKSASASRPDVSAPSKIGDYEIIDTIGRGGMGVVYRARETALGRLVALKVLLPAYASSETSIARFRHEARAVAKLNHPGIASIYRFGEADGSHFIAMELIEGPSLAAKLESVREVIDESGRSPRTTVKHLNEAARMISQVADALEYAHQAKLIHRDVKPSNILMDAHGEPHLVDFGIAKDLAEDTLTIAGGVAGTCRYMSPEQADAASVEIDHRSDIFSLGVVLYEAITLHLPFDGETPQQVLSQVISKRPRNVRACNPAISKDIETICHKALEKDPKDRYQTAAHMAADLRCYLTGDPILARPPSVVRRTKRFATRRRAVLALAATTVAAPLIAVPLYSWLTDSRPRLTVTAPPGFDVYLALYASTRDEFESPKYLGSTPIRPQRVDPGRYRIILEGSGLRLEYTRAFAARGAEQASSADVRITLTSEDVARIEDRSDEGSMVAFGGFAMSKTEVSNAEYAQYLASLSPAEQELRTPALWATVTPPADWEDLPVTTVSYEDARAYAEWCGMRLPTEREWVAATNADDQLYPWGSQPGPELKRVNWLQKPVDIRKIRERLEEALEPALSQYRALYEDGVEPVHAADHDDKTGDGLLHVLGNVAEWTDTPSGTTRRDADNEIRQVMRIRSDAWAREEESRDIWHLGAVMMDVATARRIDVGIRLAQSTSTVNEHN